MTPSPHARPSAFARFGDYEFHHWVAIQAAAGESSTVHRLFALRDADDRNAWFAARERRNEVAGYMEDLATARGLAGALSPRFRQRFPDAIGLPCRYSLIENTVRELASNLKPGLVARLVAAGHWTREQGLAWARLAGDPQQTLRSVVDALRTNRRAAEQHDLAVLALETAGAILDPDNRALAVADLAEDLPEPLLPRALEIVAAVDNEGSRAGGLRALAPRLPQPLRRHALAAVEAFHQTELGLSAHLALADGLAEPERGQQLARACEALARVVASGRSSPEETGFQTSPEESPLLKEVPLDWLERFVGVTVGGKGDWPAVADRGGQPSIQHGR